MVSPKVLLYLIGLLCVSEVSAGLTIVKRAPENILPSSVQAARDGARLSRKYAPSRVSESVIENRSIEPAATPTQTDSAGLDQDGLDYSYFAEVYLGTEANPYYLLLDCGAQQTWVMGSNCTSEPCLTHNTFGPANSTTYTAVDYPWSATYGQGSSNGTSANDTASLAGLKVPLTMGIATIASNDFNSFPIDGILGLAQGSVHYPSFLSALASSKLLPSTVFGVSLNSAGDGPNTGEVNFGAPDTSKYSGDLTYASSTSTVQWVVPVTYVGVVGNTTAIAEQSAYIDTGTSFVYGAPENVATLHSMIPGAQSTDGVQWYVPCTTNTSVIFNIGGVPFNVSASDWVGSAINEPLVNGNCPSLIVGQEIVGITGWLLGDVFLRNVYTLFDYDQNRIGFAQNLVSISSTSAAATSTAPSTASTTLPATVLVMASVAAASETLGSQASQSSPSRATSSPTLSSTSASKSASSDRLCPGQWAVSILAVLATLASLT